MHKNSLEDKLFEISKKSKLFYFGSTAIAKYKNIKTKIYKILTDLNVASLAQIIPDLKFDNNYKSNCIYISNDGEIFSFYIEEIEEQNNFEYLNRISQNNPLFNFFYDLKEHKFYNISDINLRNKNIITFDVENIHPEDLLDLALIASETDVFDFELVNSCEFTGISYQNLIYYIENILTSRNPYNALIFLEESGILEDIFPFLNDLKGINQDRTLHPEGDVFQHTLNCFQYIKYPSLRLAYGLLLHDYGKSIPSKRKGFGEHSMIGG